MRDSDGHINTNNISENNFTMEDIILTLTLSLLCVVGSLCGTVSTIFLILLKVCLNRCLDRYVANQSQDELRREEETTTTTTTTTATTTVEDAIPPSYSQFVIEDNPPDYGDVINVKSS